MHWLSLPDFPDESSNCDRLFQGAWKAGVSFEAFLDYWETFWPPCPAYYCLGMPAGTEHGSGPLLIIGVGVEMASTARSVSFLQIVSKPDHGGRCLSSHHGNLETVISFIPPRAQGTRSGLGRL